MARVKRAGYIVVSSLTTGARSSEPWTFLGTFQEANVMLENRSGYIDATFLSKHPHLSPPPKSSILCCDSRFFSGSVVARRADIYWEQALHVARSGEDTC